MKKSSSASLTVVAILLSACGGRQPDPVQPSQTSAASMPHAGSGATPAEANAKATESERPNPLEPTADQAKIVASFDGDWTYDASITLPKQKPAKMPLGVSCKAVAGKKAVSCTMETVVPGKGPFEGRFLIGHDPLDSTLHVMAITSEDELHDHHCKWNGDKRITCEAFGGNYAGQPMTEDLAFSFEGAPSFTSVTTLKDGSKISFESTNGKKGTLPSKKEAGKAKSPAASAEQKKTVEAFLGTWQIDAKLTGPDGKATNFPVKFEASKYAFGKALAGSMTASTPMGPLETAFLLGHDPADKTVHFITVTNHDELHDYRCKWADEKKLTCEPVKGGLGGAPVTEDLAFAFDAPGTMSFTSIMTLNNGAKMTFEGQGKR